MKKLIFIIFQIWCGRMRNFCAPSWCALVYFLSKIIMLIFYRYSNSKFEKVSSVVLEPKSMFLVPSMTNNGTTALTPKWRVDLIWESNSLHEFWDFFEKGDTFCLLGAIIAQKANFHVSWILIIFWNHQFSEIKIWNCFDFTNILSKQTQKITFFAILRVAAE